MLSAKSEIFIDNLRLYLMTSGKNELEVKELTEELRDHLVESEKQGKSIDQIIDGTPEAYMESLKKEMKTDYRSLFNMIPYFLLGSIAFYLMGPAIRGQFELNIVQVIGFPVVLTLSFLIYVVFLQKAGKKQYSTKKLFMVGMIASFSVTAFFIILILGSRLVMDPFYKASPTANGLVMIVCTIIFIVIAIWSKTWISIWIPAVLFIPDFLYRFSKLEDEVILIMNGVSFILIFILLIVNVLITEKRKKKRSSEV